MSLNSNGSRNFDHILIQHAQYRLSEIKKPVKRFQMKSTGRRDVQHTCRPVQSTHANKREQ